MTYMKRKQTLKRGERLGYVNSSVNSGATLKDGTLEAVSSSGSYPINDWETQLDRIEKVVKKYGKPFFFAECGCMSVKGSVLVPNDWSVRGDPDPEGQADWFKAMFSACVKRDWVGGFAVWDWRDKLYPLSAADTDMGYGIYGKPAEEVVKEFYSRR